MLKARITLFEDMNDPLGNIHNSLTAHDRQNFLLGYGDISTSRDDAKQIIRSTSLNMRHQKEGIKFKSGRMRLVEHDKWANSSISS